MQAITVAKASYSSQALAIASSTSAIANSTSVSGLYAAESGLSDGCRRALCSCMKLQPTATLTARSGPLASACSLRGACPRPAAALQCCYIAAGSVLASNNRSQKKNPCDCLNCTQDSTIIHEPQYLDSLQSTFRRRGCLSVSSNNCLSVSSNNCFSSKKTLRKRINV